MLTKSVRWKNSVSNADYWARIFMDLRFVIRAEMNSGSIRMSGF
jgi:hypothetical protein